MAADYPSSVTSFSAINNGDVITDTMWEAAYDEIVALEQALLSGGFAHDLFPSTNNARDLGTSSLKWKDLYLAGELLSGDGAVETPGVSFASDPDVGLYREGANRLSVATAGVKALEVDATQFIDSPTQPRLVAFDASTQTVTAGNTTALELDSEDVDVGTLHDLVTNNSRVTIPAGGDGFYLVLGQAQVSYGAGTAALHIRKNGTTTISTAQLLNATAIHTAAVMWAGNLVATDYVELMGQAVSANATFGSATRGLATQLVLVKLW